MKHRDFTKFHQEKLEISLEQQGFAAMTVLGFSAANKWEFTVHQQDWQFKLQTTGDMMRPANGGLCNSFQSVIPVGQTQLRMATCHEDLVRFFTGWGELGETRTPMILCDLLLPFEIARWGTDPESSESSVMVR